MALLIFHSSCIGYVLSLARMGLFHGTFKLRRFLLLDVQVVGQGMGYAAAQVPGLGGGCLCRQGQDGADCQDSQDHPVKEGSFFYHG